jgi:osmoprotectant transport system permease protein
VIPNYGGPPGGTHGCIAQNGTFCWDWVKGHWGDILQPRLLEHLEMTAIAVGIGFAIAFAAALLAHRKGWFETPFGVFSAFLYTIPSLALFQLLVPFTGLTMLTIEIGLVGYTLLILFRNILAGLRGVP